MSGILNGDFDLKENLNEGAATFRNMVLGTPLLEIAKIPGAKNMTGEYLNEIASNPEVYKDRLKTPEQKQNFEYLTQIHEALKAREDLTPEQKTKFQLLSLQAKILGNSISKSPDKDLVRSHEKQLRAIEIEKQSIVDPDMTNTIILQKLYEEGTLPKDAEMMLVGEDGKVNPKGVGEYLKYIAQQANGLTSDWKPDKNGAANLKGRVPDQVIEMANERWKDKIPKEGDEKSINAYKDEIASIDEMDISDAEKEKLKEEADKRHAQDISQQMEQPTEVNIPKLPTNETTQEIPASPKPITTEKIVKPEEASPEGGEGATGEPPAGAAPTAAGEEGNKVGVSHEKLNELADRLGLKQPKRGEYLSPQWYADRGRELLDNGADPESITDSNEKLHDRISVGRAHLEDLVKHADDMFNQHGVDSQEFRSAARQVDLYSDKVKALGTEAHRAFTSLQGERDLDTGSFTAIKKAKEEATGKPLTKEQNEKAANLAKAVSDLTKEVDNLKRKLTEALNKGVKEEEAKTVKQKSKDLADKIRKAKIHRPGMFSAATPASVVWDGAVEVVAKAVEAGGEFADAISKGVRYLQSTNWYKKLSDEDKGKAEKQFTEWHEDKQELSPEEKNIKRLEKELENLRQGIAKQSSPKRELSDREKELQDEIFEERKKLGLVKSKETKPEEQEESDESKRESLAKKYADKKGTKFTAEESKEIWDYAKEQYIDNGADFEDAINGVATDLGMTNAQVREAIVTPKEAKKISDEMYRMQYRRNAAMKNAEAWSKYANENKVIKIAKGIPGFFFGLKTFGHGTVGMVTHGGLNVFRLSKAKQYWRNFFKQFGFAYGDTAKYQKAMNDLKNDPDFIFWKRSGLAVDPSEVYDDYQMFTKFFGKLGKAGDRGFNALKVYRLEQAKAIWKGLSNTEKADPGTPKQIADIVNHATGTSRASIPKASYLFFFAPHLEISRWQRMIVEPTKAIATYINWKNATPAEKVAAKIVTRRAAETLSTYVSLLFVNQALLSLTGSNQSINFLDPTKSDWLKMKGFGRTLDWSGGMRSSMAFIFGLVDNGLIKTKSELPKGDSRWDVIKSSSGDYVSGKFSPFFSTIKDFLTQHDFKGNVMPFSSDKPQAGKHKLSWGEYLLAQQTPIPIAEAYNDIKVHMEEKGLSKPDVQIILGGIITGTVSGGTGGKLGEEPHQRPTPFTEEDKKDPVFKKWMDKGYSLPNTSLTSELITDEDNATKLRVSDYPREKQDEYVKTHKRLLKEVLQEIDDNNEIYIKFYKDKEGNAESEVSLKEPSGEYQIKPLSKLNKEEGAQVLSLAQKEATRRAKKEVFSNE